MSSSSADSPTRFRQLIVPLAVVLAVLICDQAGKFWIANLSGLDYGAYPPNGGIEVIPGLFSIVYSTNAGAAWGMFSGHGIILSLVGCIALALIVIYRRHLGLERRAMQIVTGLMCGGILGNLIDRVLFGRVTDFLDFHIGAHHWPTFNIADASMVVAVCLYFLVEWFRKPEKPTTPSA